MTKAKSPANPKPKKRTPKADKIGQTNTTLKKEAMLNALESVHGIVSDAARKANICRSTHYEWMGTDPEYKKAVIEIQDAQLDFTESMLYGQIAKGDTTAIIFHLKCQGKRRGYSETAKLEDDTKPQTAGFDWKPL